MEIRFKPKDVEVHTYLFLLQPREIENTQFPWTFQRQLYDCLHDYVIEMFTSTLSGKTHEETSQTDATRSASS